ncbi:MAG: glycosyltransferase [Flavobacteriales bacterium]
MKKLLIIGHTFPEPTTTAAGRRMMQLIHIFNKASYNITFATTASISKKSENLEKWGIKSKNIQINNPNFDVFLKKANPSIVLFDRFITEEQFGWRVSENCPEALKILDTEDLHFLRKAREEAFKKEGNLKNVNLYSEIAKREIASIYRCDLSLIISEFEMQLLQNKFKIDASLLFYMPLLVNTLTDSEKNELPSFYDRTHFITVGNLLHAPNIDSVLYLKKEIWTGIRAKLPKAELHIYGNYASQQVRELHQEKEGFFIKGWTESVNEVMKHARICLAPLNYGAGIKGKILDAFKNGTPCVTSSIGVEGISAIQDFGGHVEDEKENFITAAIQLYTSKSNWKAAQEKGFNLIQNSFNEIYFYKPFITKIIELLKSISTHREYHFMGQILQHQHMQSTKYLSKWIEEKNRNKQ